MTALVGPRRATWLAERALRVRAGRVPTYSSLDEEEVVRRLVGRLGRVEKYAVDIGASDGVRGSNTYSLFRRGWRGVAVECDGEKFRGLQSAHAGLGTRLVHAKATPPDIVDLLRAHGVPKEFTFLSIDIDSYDYFVLDALLDAFRPLLICAEINETIPPPLRFTVLWDPGHAWNGDLFFGQSISQLAHLAETKGYALVELHYNNAFLVPRELDVAPALTPEEAYRRGYAARRDRAEKFPWNKEVDAALSMNAKDAEAFFRSIFADYQGRYELAH